MIQERTRVSDPKTASSQEWLSVYWETNAECGHEKSWSGGCCESQAERECHQKMPRQSWISVKLPLVQNLFVDTCPFNAPLLVVETCVNTPGEKQANGQIPSPHLLLFTCTSAPVTELQKDSRHPCFIHKPQVCSTYKLILPLRAALVRLRLGSVLTFGNSHCDRIGTKRSTVSRQDGKRRAGLRKSILACLKNKSPREKCDTRLLKTGRCLPVLHIPRGWGEK